MYRIKRGKKIKDLRKKGFSLSKKCIWCEQHSPARQSKRSVRNVKKSPKRK